VNAVKETTKLKQTFQLHHSHLNSNALTSGFEEGNMCPYSLTKNITVASTQTTFAEKH
jgi:hypothetical protein